MGVIALLSTALTPWMWDLVQVLLNLLIREVFVHLTEEVGNHIVFTFLILQGEVVASKTSYPSLPSSIQIGR